MQDSAIKKSNVKALIRMIVYIMIDSCNGKYSANYNIANLPVVNFFNQVSHYKFTVHISRIKVIPIIVQIEQIVLKTVIRTLIQTVCKSMTVHRLSYISYSSINNQD